MSLFRHVRTLLSMKQPATAPQQGPAYALLPADTDKTTDTQVRFRLLAQPVPSSPAPPVEDGTEDCPCLPELDLSELLPELPEGTEVSPSSEPKAVVVLETSADHRQWVQLLELPVDGAVLTEPFDLGPYVRARTLGDAEHQVEVLLLATASYKLERS